MKPLTPVAPLARIALGIAFFVLFVAVWSAATFGGWVNPIFLADPLTMLRSGWTLLTEQGFALRHRHDRVARARRLRHRRAAGACRWAC